MEEAQPEVKKECVEKTRSAEEKECVKETRPAEEKDCVKETRPAEEQAHMVSMETTETMATERKKIMEKLMKIEGMMCGHCTGRVQKALEAVEGVSTVTMNLEEKTALVVLKTEVADEALTAAVTDAGYEVKEIL